MIGTLDQLTATGEIVVAATDIVGSGLRIKFSDDTLVLVTPAGIYGQIGHSERPPSQHDWDFWSVLSKENWDAALDYLGLHVFPIPAVVRRLVAQVIEA